MWSGGTCFLIVILNSEKGASRHACPRYQAAPARNTMRNTNRLLCASFVMKTLVFMLFATLSMSESARSDVFTDARYNCLRACVGACCEERCDYGACIARETTVQMPVGQMKDPGAWGTAMAVCTPFIQIIQQCAKEHVEGRYGKCAWKYTNTIGDYAGADDSPWTTGSMPQVTRCHPQYRGNTATCWDGASVNHPGRSGYAWCTYKHISKSAYRRGGNAGRVYECVCH